MTKIERPNSTIQSNVSEIPENQPSANLGKVETLNGSPTETIPLLNAKSVAGDEAGTLKMAASVMRQGLEKALDLEKKKGPEPQNVKWEGPDFDAIKK